MRDLRPSTGLMRAASKLAEVCREGLAMALEF